MIPKDILEKINHRKEKYEELLSRTLSSNPNKRFMLFISPYESRTNKWEIMFFDSEEDRNLYINYNDLTKRYYGVTIESLVNMLEDKWGKQ